ncbi:stage II sporulation protein P [Romboutsia sp.]|uniref:stage II sporulation protein P n=1 Tax=Romboutsia sp. TaxID=1965302 RepID=UPI003F33010C
MLKKRIKAVCIAYVLVCILPVSSYAMDKDDFLKYLINSSYPESSTTDSTQSNNNENKKDVPDQNKDYIKVHIGEENVPIVNKDNKTATSDTQYKNDIRVTKENPRILIYHTHSCETYSNSPSGNYHSQDKPNSVMAVGKELTDQLTNLGWGVVHTTKYNDYPSYNGAYASSLKTINQIMPQYPSVDIAIDLHREGKDLTDENTKKKEEAKFTTTINGEKVAKFFLVVGQKNPNVDHVRKVAEGITSLAQKKYPGLVLPVVEKPYGKFNQYIAKDHMLIEIGSNATSTEEAKATAKYVASVLDEYFKQNK